MGVSNSPLEFAAKCVVASKAIEEATKVSVESTALSVKKSITEISPSRLRGVGKRGAKLGVRYNIGEFPDGKKALVYATGPWQLIEGNTQAHVIPRERGPRAKKRVVAFGSVVYSRVNHPGTKGKHLFAQGATVGLTAGGQIAKREVSAAIRTVF